MSQCGCLSSTGWFRSRYNVISITNPFMTMANLILVNQYYFPWQTTCWVCSKPTCSIGMLLSTYHPFGLDDYVVNMCQWWSVGTFSFIFSSLLRISKKGGLWLMSAAQHCSINLKHSIRKKRLALWITALHTYWVCLFTNMAVDKPKF